MTFAGSFAPEQSVGVKFTVTGNAVGKIPNTVGVTGTAPGGANNPKEAEKTATLTVVETNVKINPAKWFAPKVVQGKAGDTTTATLKASVDPSSNVGVPFILESRTNLLESPDFKQGLLEGISPADVQGIRVKDYTNNGSELPQHQDQSVSFKVVPQYTPHTGEINSTDAKTSNPGETKPSTVANTAFVTTQRNVIVSKPATGNAEFMFVPGQRAAIVSKTDQGSLRTSTSAGQQIMYTLKFINTGNEPLTNPVFTDLLPSDGSGALLEYKPEEASATFSKSPVDASITVDPALISATFSSKPNNSSVVINFPAGSVLFPGETYTIQLPLYVRAGLPPTQNIENNFYRYPCVVETRPGADAEWKLNVRNTGNVPTNRLEIIEILPFVGDHLLSPKLTDISLGTQWAPTFKELTNISAPEGTTTTVKYLVGDPSACKSNGDKFSDDPWGTGCAEDLFTQTPPTDLSTVTGFKITFEFTKPMAPLSGVGISFLTTSGTKMPAGAAELAPAWNTFAYVGSAVVSGRPENFQQEPNQTGITFRPIPDMVSVGDYVWVDADRDGVQSVGEKGIEGVVLTIAGPDGKTVTDVFGKVVGPVSTDKDGKYTFEGLPVLKEGQSYTVRIDKDASAGPFAAYIPTLSGVGDRATDSLTWTASSESLTKDGDRDSTLDFGFVLPPEVPVVTPPTTPDSNSKLSNTGFNKSSLMLLGLSLSLLGVGVAGGTMFSRSPESFGVGEKDSNFSRHDQERVTHSALRNELEFGGFLEDT